MGNKYLVFSNDADVLVAMLYFWKTFKQHCACELWIRGGTGDTTRFISIYILARKVGLLCEALPAAHFLTGSDVTSKGRDKEKGE